MLTLTCPIKTPLHRIAVGPKLLALAVTSVALFQLQNLWLIAAIMAVVAGLHLAFGRAFARHAAAMLRPLWPFLLILGVWHGWTGEWATGAALAGKMLVAVALANLVTMTSRLEDMIALIERLSRPLARFGLSPRALAVAMALVIRFTPVLMEKTAQLGMAWRARSTRRANWRIMLPVSLMALDDADHVAEAIRARGGL
ncbi:energy-coupling factor transporter transmembrane component T family protein [Pseudorhodobacter aquimaris]|uniref:energy-coupling factor transporter transmembrane component T family protein n=1 Tax=Pseudorhodobacter aquimaris TaxID=687412 RepID=UPI00067D75CC|nr:energy-coupling factor transporter transmembrane protein EcfT [Pseudorhodobacter aquimaris]